MPVVKKKNTIIKVVEEIIDVTCNMCGNTCIDSQGANYEGLIDARIQGGFDSKLGDGIEYGFSLCEDCLSELFKKFKHPPDKDMGNYLGGCEEIE
jgi:hypothetical protein